MNFDAEKKHFRPLSEDEFNRLVAEHCPGAHMTRPLLPQDQPHLSALGLRMQQARERRNISAELMAERLGVTIETVHSLENGDASIALADVFRALRILGLADDLDFLAQDAEL